MSTEIVKRENPVLRQIAREVPIHEITTPYIQETIRHMKEALATQDDGAALAAPQIAESLRIFVISEKFFGDNPESDHRSKDPHFVFINPEFVKLSKRKRIMDEGCLSVRGHYGNVMRHDRATIRAYDEHGNLFTRGAGGLLAQVFQHETDHLNGILFIDRADELWDEEKLHE